MLTSAQLQTLKTNILATPEAESLYVNGDLIALANYYNSTASPDYWVWRTKVTRADIYNSVSPDATTWNWTTYKSQSVTEQNAWTQMFMGDEADFSKKNLRDGVAAIFTGSAPQLAQQTHVLAMGRKKATRLEKLFAVDTTGSGAGRGISTDPDTMVVEGIIDYSELIGL
jgi:hypothetical protein